MKLAMLLNLLNQLDKPLLALRVALEIGWSSVLTFLHRLLKQYGLPSGGVSKLASLEKSSRMRVALRRIARRVRTCIEEIAKSDFRSPHRCTGYCGRASAMLQQELRHAGFNARIAYVCEDHSGHAFVVVDNHLVDVTATQFGIFGRTVIRKFPYNKYWFWRNPVQFFDTPKDWIEYQTSNGWTPWQIGTIQDLSTVVTTRN